MNPDQIARREAEFLMALPATVSVDGATITLASSGGQLVIECRSEDRFLIGYPPTKGGFPVQGTSQPQVELTRAELFNRAREWARSKQAS
jgi:hypothetical protein